MAKNNSGIIISGGNISTDAMVSGKNSSSTVISNSKNERQTEILNTIREIEASIIRLNSKNQDSLISDVNLIKNSVKDGEKNEKTKSAINNILTHIKDINALTQFGGHLEKIFRYFQL